MSPNGTVLTDGAGLEILDRSECFRLLAGVRTGRIALSVRALPTILPVRFALDDERIVIRVGADSTLAAATRCTVVAFESEGQEPAEGREWSVLVTGRADHVTDDAERSRLEALGLPDWSFPTPGCLVSISADQLEGRRTLGPR